VSELQLVCICVVCVFVCITCWIEMMQCLNCNWCASVWCVCVCVYHMLDLSDAVSELQLVCICVFVTLWINSEGQILSI